ncbi:MAG: CBS domain-containing protein [Paraglaciecola sp.]|jgi:CBS domain-containing protein
MKNTKLKLKAAVSTIMTTELTTVREETSYAALKDLFNRYSMRHILMENKEGELLGIISTEDLTKSRHFLGLEDKLEARHIMTPKPVSVEFDTPIRKVIELFLDATAVTINKNATTIRKVIELFLDNRFRAVPVVNEDNVLVGIVTAFDILHEFVEG